MQRRRVYRASGQQTHPHFGQRNFLRLAGRCSQRFGNLSMPRPDQISVEWSVNFSMNFKTKFIIFLHFSPPNHNPSSNLPWHSQIHPVSQGHQRSTNKAAEMHRALQGVRVQKDTVIVRFCRDFQKLCDFFRDSPHQYDYHWHAEFTHVICCVIPTG